MNHDKSELENKRQTWTNDVKDFTSQAIFSQFFKFGWWILNEIMKLILNIKPKPQSRPRFARRGNFTTTYEAGDMKTWRRKCTDLIAEECLLDKVAEGPVRLSVVFYISPPQYIKKIKKNQQALADETMPVYKKPDLDNYIKALLDSISDSSLLWKDDGQVSEIHAKKVYSLNPRIEVEIEELK